MYTYHLSIDRIWNQLNKCAMHVVMCVVGICINFIRSFDGWFVFHARYLITST